jgi:hypothetical protein
MNLLNDRLKRIAAADGCYAQVEAGMFRMAASFDEVFFSFLRGANLQQYRRGLSFSKVGAQSALTFFNMKHNLKLLPLQIALLIRPSQAQIPCKFL